jgi:hypothetical protein
MEKRCNFCTTSTNIRCQHTIVTENGWYASSCLTSRLPPMQAAVSKNGTRLIQKTLKNNSKPHLISLAKERNADSTAFARREL